MNIIIPAAIIAVVLLALIFGLISRYRTPKADEAFVVTGTGKGHQGKVYLGTGTFVLPVVQKCTVVSLTAVQAELKATTPAQDGIELAVSAVAQVKVNDDPEAILKAAQRFTDDTSKIRGFVTEQLSGELRALIGTMPAHQILTNRRSLIDQVSQAIEGGLKAQGLQLDSFVINSVNDADGSYFSDLAAGERANKRIDAAKATARAEQESAQAIAESTANSKTAEAQAAQRIKEIEISTQQAVVDQQRELEIAQLEARKLTDKAQAEADAALPLAQAERQLVQLTKEREIADSRAELRDRELDAEVRRPAEAQRYAAEQNAAADKNRRIAEAEARAQEIKLNGDAEAQAIRAKGEAEAEAINKRAEALQKMDEVGRLELILDKMPAIVAAAAEPLRGANLTLIGSDTDAVTNSVARTAGGSLEAIKSVTGVDLAELVANFGQRNLPAGADNGEQ